MIFFLPPQGSYQLAQESGVSWGGLQIVLQAPLKSLLKVKVFGAIEPCNVPKSFTFSKPWGRGRGSQQSNLQSHPLTGSPGLPPRVQHKLAGPLARKKNHLHPPAAERAEGSACCCSSLPFPLKRQEDLYTSRGVMTPTPV